MKKILFALEMFGLLVMFPMYVLLEMNHNPGRLKGNNMQPRVKEQIEKTGTRLHENLKSENTNDIFEIGEKMLLTNTY